MDFRLSVSPRKEMENCRRERKFFLDLSANPAHDLRIISTTALSTELRDKRAAGRS